MEKVLYVVVVFAILSLTACQVNDIHDTGGGAVAPTSTVIGVNLERYGGNDP